ncbi:hypothetical protein MLD52_18385 [Puniceicoccaceae bacterium K14]|nr:hypothetical protein [Puniceicoccaceae bacterium K14]
MKHTHLILTFLAFFAAALQAADEKPILPTEIEAEFLQLENDGEEAYVIAKGSVILTATNLELLCDKLELWVKRTGQKDATIGNFGDFEKVLATGNVQITQAERIAKAGIMELDPLKEQIFLRENPSVYQSGTTLTGHEMIIKRGEGLVIVPGTAKHKVRFVGPAIQDLGFESDKKIEEKKDEADDSDSTETPKPEEAPEEETGEAPTIDPSKETEE